MLRELQKVNELEEYFGIVELVVVEFWAPWCVSCKAYAEVLKQVQDALDEGVLICTVNVDQLPDLGTKYHITSLPTTVKFRGGVEECRISGAIGPTDLLKFVRL